MTELVEVPITEVKAKADDEVRLVFMTDPHFSAHNPPSWKPGTSYPDELERSVSQVFTFAKKNNVDAVVWGGDFFNLKSASRNPLWFLARVISFFRDGGLTNIGIVGNHDVKYGSMEGLPGQPVEVLLAAQTFHLLDKSSWLFKAKDFSVKVSGRSYQHSQAKPIVDLKKGTASYLVGVGHFWFGKVTGEFFGEPVYGPDTLEKSEVDVYMIGHHHDDQGVQVINGKTYAVAGSITRTGAHKQDLTRAPAAVYVVFTKKGVEAKVLRPKVTPLDTLIDLTVREQLMEESKAIDEFISSLSSVNLQAQDPMKVVDELGLDQKVKEAVLRYLEAAERERV